MHTAKEHSFAYALNGADLLLKFSSISRRSCQTGIKNQYELSSLKCHSYLCFLMLHAWLAVEVMLTKVTFFQMQMKSVVIKCDLADDHKGIVKRRSHKDGEP